MRLRAVVTCLLLLASSGAAAQATPKSQLATVAQRVAGANIEIVYRRPVARGRTLFGTLVPWNRLWSPSADSAARITLSSPVTVNGTSLAAGTYGVWSTPDSISWIIVFNQQPFAHHLRHPGGPETTVRAIPQRGEHVETLQFSFPMVDADSATLHLRWGTMIVPLTIRVP